VLVTGSDELPEGPCSNVSETAYWQDEDDIYFEKPPFIVSQNADSELFPSLARRGARRAGWF
jgi:hypothetical protein